MIAVLVVDDSLTVRMDLVEALEERGLRAVGCGTLAEARTKLQDPAFGLMILDVVLPDGDGIELLRELRATPATARMPVLVLSSAAEVADRARGLMTGADEYVGKPYDREALAARAVELARSRRGTTVLVVDDSPTYRDALRAALEAASYEVVDAASGEIGLRLAAELRPDAMLVDGVLPGIDGATVIRRLRLDAALRRTPCVLLTASDDADAELRALDAGADAFVRKDGDLELVLARLAAVLRTVAVPARGGPQSLASRKRILAVDDSPTFLQVLAAALTERGFDVRTATSGEEALDRLTAEPVDCIVLDRIMPGIGGEEACRRIKAAPGMRDTPLVMLTALGDREAMIQGFGAGADDYITKSADFAVLEARVLAQIRRKQFEDENRRIREELVRNELEIVEARAERTLAAARAVLLEDLERKNRELEAFSYSVSHDLRTPLRSIDGFSAALLEDCADQLDERGKDYLHRVRAAAQRMSSLIDDLLELSRVGRAELRRSPVDLGLLAADVFEGLRRGAPEREVTCEVAAGLGVHADPGLMRVVLDNLLGNAWKFTVGAADARIEVGVEGGDPPVFYVRDNGTGFDLAFAGKLFSPFQRLHRQDQFPGTGIGLATVARIVDRHGGRVWADARPGAGATFRFTLARPGRTG